MASCQGLIRMAGMVDSGATVRSVPQGRQPRRLISSKQVEKVMSRSVAVVGIVFGAQTVPWLLGQLHEAYPLWLWLVIPALFGTLVLVVVLSFVRVWVRPAHGLFAIVFLAALVSWPFAVIPSVDVFSGIHWLDYILTVATAMATIAFSARVACSYLFLVSLIYGTVRVTAQGGSAPWQLAVLETVYALILGAAIMILITMLRQAATKVDAAQAAALDRYGLAVRQHAVEVERVQVDSIVHDNVLATLRSAARADTPEAHALVATMASNAIGHLRDAAAVSPGDPAMMPLAELAVRIAGSASQLSGPVRVRVRTLGTRSVPWQVADAVHSASVQAMVNSTQHAGDERVSRWVTIRGLAPERAERNERIPGVAGIEVIVGDTGAGFTLTEVPGERLGVRVSIIERIANAGGLASVASARGEGTVVTIRWPHEHVVTAGPDPLAAVKGGAR